MTNRKTTVWILGDQLLRSHPAVEQTRYEGDDFRILLVENWHRARRLPYHRKKITLIFSAMRHYADLLRADGCTVDYVRTESLRDALNDHVDQYRPDRILTMAASEYPGRQFQENLQALLNLPVEILPNTQFLTGQYNPNPDPNPDKQYIMEYFYREMRRHFDVLMDGPKQPAGGEWNFDKQNRKPLPKKGLDAPPVPGFEPDDITRSVMDEVQERDYGVGSVEGFSYAVTHEQAQQALDDFIAERLEDFGPYEDAMTADHRTLFHSVLSPYINLGLLEPMQMIRAAETAYREGRAPINSVEGFIRQIIGWREYMWWQYWQQMPGLLRANEWGADRPMPQLFWDGQTDMNCIRHVVDGLMDSGYSHHIERLMVISNFCLMAGIEPQAVTDWFKSFYIDAYDWVMQTNVVGMGLNADGGRTATKPYVASANYINKMSDYCQGCRYNHKQRHGEDACPFNYLYWNFLIKHEEKLRSHPRFGPAVLGLRHLDDEERAQVQQQAQEYLDSLDYYTG